MKDSTRGVLVFLWIIAFIAALPYVKSATAPSEWVVGFVAGTILGTYKEMFRWRVAENDNDVFYAIVRWFILLFLLLVAVVTVQPREELVVPIGITVLLWEGIVKPFIDIQVAVRARQS